MRAPIPLGSLVRNTAAVDVLPILHIPVGTRGRVAWTYSAGVRGGMAVGVVFDSAPQTVIGVSADKLELITPSHS